MAAMDIKTWADERAALLREHHPGGRSGMSRSWGGATGGARVLSGRATLHWTFRCFMAAMFWAFLTFAGFSLAYTAPADTRQQWGGSGLAVVAFAFLVCKIAGVRVRDVAGAVRRAWRW
jgi:hypothetical protein